MTKDELYIESITACIQKGKCNAGVLAWFWSFLQNFIIRFNQNAPGWLVLIAFVEILIILGTISAFVTVGDGVVEVVLAGIWPTLLIYSVSTIVKIFLFGFLKPFFKKHHHRDKPSFMDVADIKARLPKEVSIRNAFASSLLERVVLYASEALQKQASTIHACVVYYTEDKKAMEVKYRNASCGRGKIISKKPLKYIIGHHVCIENEQRLKADKSPTSLVLHDVKQFGENIGSSITETKNIYRSVMWFPLISETAGEDGDRVVGFLAINFIECCAFSQKDASLFWTDLEAVTNIFALMKG